MLRGQIQVQVQYEKANVQAFYPIPVLLLLLIKHVYEQNPNDPNLKHIDDLKTLLTVTACQGRIYFGRACACSFGGEKIILILILNVQNMVNFEHF